MTALRGAAALLRQGLLAAAALTAGAVFVAPAGAQSDSAYRAWNEPVPPFRILDNLYYVGARDVTAFLFVTPAGGILLDGGFAETAPQIEANIRTLGFDPKDVRVLLNSHAHFDHAGGLARLKALTGATLYASPEDAEALARGGRGDYALGDRHPFAPVRADSILRDGQVVSLGGTRLTAVFTPGHTKGCTTWTTALHDGATVRRVVFVCSLSVIVPGEQLSTNDAYPTILFDYRRSFGRVRALPCDMLLGPHGSFFDLEGKRRLLADTSWKGRNPFIRGGECRSLADRAEAALGDSLRTARRRTGRAP